MNSVEKIFLVWILLMFRGGLCFAQDYQWWNDKHNWDGITPWHDYIITSPAFMGPNALAVPTIKNGTIPQNAYFKFGLDKHISPGDKTENLRTELYLPLFSHRVGLNVELIPIEHYKMDTLTRDIRRARNINGEGFVGGDFYIGTYIQLIENNKKIPDILLTINLKTASGSKLSDARYTDAPGYFFDLSFGKTINLNEQKTKLIKPHAMLGFYVWQLHGNSQFQNDAVLYGLGVDFVFPALEINTAFGGYYGYLGNGDRPMIYRLIFRSKFDSMFNYELGFQQGVHDYSYTSFSLSCNANLTKIKKHMAKNKDH